MSSLDKLMYDLAHFLLENNVKIVILVKVNAQGTTRCSQNKHPLTMNDVLFKAPTLKVLHHKKHWQIFLSIIKKYSKKCLLFKILTLSRKQIPVDYVPSKCMNFFLLLVDYYGFTLIKLEFK
jgi:hypothetical protein